MLSCPFVPRGTRNVARDEHQMYCTWFAHDCARAAWAYVCGESSRCSEEIAQKKNKQTNKAKQNLQLSLLMRLLSLLSLSLNLKVCLLIGCLTSQQQASVSQERSCTDNFTCCHTEIEAADQTFHLTQSQYTDTGPTSPSADPTTPGAWQGSHWSANV